MFLYKTFMVSLVTQMVKNLPAMGETQVQSLGWEDPLEKGMVIHSSIFAWKIAWTEELGRLQSMRSQESDTTEPLSTHTRILSLRGFPGGSVVKNPPVMMWVSHLGQADSLEKEMTVHSGILAWRIPWTEEPRGLQSMGVSKSQTGTINTFMTSFSLVQFSLVAQSCPTPCDPINQSTPGLPVYYQLPEFAQTHIHRVSDAIQPSHPLSSPSPPAPNPSQHQSLFQ